jgi:hypothetical protein
VVSKYSEYVEIAMDGPSFVNALETALRKGRQKEYRDFAAQFSWESVFKDMMTDCRLS